MSRKARLEDQFCCKIMNKMEHGNASFYKYSWRFTPSHDTIDTQCRERAQLEYLLQGTEMSVRIALNIPAREKRPITAAMW
mmetsp:Transcript_1258/g.2107  ORF Transcript_1258/g.2107 Transcript_1258/m.2107 type:complete len:81 (+) Transcript_1258:76-318(+)